MSINEILEIKGYVINLVSYYPRTISEIRKRLLNKKFKPENIEQAIKELSEKKYLDDEEYVREWLEKQLKYRPCGKMLCKAQLLKRGIEEEIADQVVQEEYSRDKELKIAQGLVDKKFSKTLKSKDIDAQKNKNKLGNFLKNKGFSSEIILEIINSDYELV